MVAEAADHVARMGGHGQAAVLLDRDGERLRLGDLVPGHHPRAERGEGVEALANVPRVAHGVAGAHVARLYQRVADGMDAVAHHDPRLVPIEVADLHRAPPASAVMSGPRRYFPPVAVRIAQQEGGKGTTGLERPELAQAESTAALGKPPMAGHHLVGGPEGEGEAKRRGAALP